MITERARHESLRDLAAEYGISPEAIRAALREAGRAHLLEDPGRRRRLAARAPLPPPAPAKVPQERHAEVVLLCQRHTQAEVAALLGVSQTTVWRILQRVRRSHPHAASSD